MIGNRTQLNRLGKNHPDDHPDPIRKPLTVKLGVELFETAVDLSVYLLATAHWALLMIGLGTISIRHSNGQWSLLLQSIFAC